MKDPIYHPLPGRSFPPLRESVLGKLILPLLGGAREGLRVRDCLHSWFLLFLLFLALPLSAQRFFNLTVDEVSINGALPQFTYTVPLPSDYADSAYRATVLYPEFIDMPEADIAALHRIEHDSLSALPRVTARIVMERRHAFLRMTLCPLAYRDGNYRILASFMLRVDATANTTSRANAKMFAVTRAPQRTANAPQADRYAAHSRLAGGKWAKIRVPSTGIYQLTPSLIRQAGFTDINKIKVYGYGGHLQNEVLVGAELQATDDLAEVPQCIVGGKHLFYAKGPVSWSSNTAAKRTRNPYANYGYYFLTENNDTVAATDSTAFLNNHYPSADDYHSLYEVDGYAWYHGGRNLFDPETITQGHTKRLVLTNPSASAKGRLSVNVSAGVNSQAQVMVNDSVLGNLYIQLTSYDKASSRMGTYTVRNLHATDTVKIICTSGGPLRLDFVSMAWEKPAPKPDLNASFPTPEYVGSVANQDLHADGPADMVIIVPASGKLLEQAQRLAAFHQQHDSLRVRIVAADKLYNEFSSGTPDANAYRRYLKMLYDRAATDADLPRYLLLFGNSVWDNRMLTSDCSQLNPDDYLLCYESENSFNEIYCYVDDGFFCRLDDGEGANPRQYDMDDVGVGRFPVSTPDEAKVMVDKVIAYTQNNNAGAWQNTLMFMGDDGNYNIHMNDENYNADYIATLHPQYVIKKVMWDAYEEQTSSTGNSYPGVTAAIRQQQQAGALIMDYAGHGRADMVSHEAVLRLSDFQNFTNKNLPLWVMASCDIMAFDDVEDNIGKASVLNANGGAIAMFGTTRTVLTNYNKLINRAFLKNVLTRTGGKAMTLGEAQRLAKNLLITSKQDTTVNKLQYSLLGDPALGLNLPSPMVVVDSINGMPTTASGMPRLKAGSIARVAGHIEGHNDFNGVATIVVRDTRELVTCRLNTSAQADDPFTFYDRTKTLYTGADSVRHGRFAIALSVPMDINYTDETGLINVFAVSNDKTLYANGYSEHFTVGGTSTETADTIGPALFCYLNTPEFKDGAQVNCTPYFVAQIADPSGINTTGNGIGHYLQLVIDGDANKSYNLNNYFNYDFGSYTRGTAAYSIPSLEPGKHTLLFRAWDVNNNASTATLNFTVVKSLQPSISSVSASNNPATTTTTFIVNHDMSGSKADVCVEVFDMSGRELWKHTDTGVTTNGTYTVDWNLCDGKGCRVQTGVYLYRVRMASDGSSYTSKTRKLIVIRQ